MMTIKEFAALCACTTQTLRYYDRIGLLKPSRVDQWTNYRYYEREQALDFVKIKHLQSADFSIEEIKQLLTKPECEVYDAFDQKIAEQEQKLERIKQIQQSYLEEKNAMEKIMQEITNYLFTFVNDYEILREFGLDPKDGEAVLQQAKDYMLRGLIKHAPSKDAVQLTVGEEVYRGIDEVSEKIGQLSKNDVSKTLLIGDETVSEQPPYDPENCETILERHGWEHVHEFIDVLPMLKDSDEDRDYIFHFQLREVPEADDLSFSMTLFGVVLTKQDIGDSTLNCVIEPSKDGANHFSLMRSKQIHRSSCPTPYPRPQAPVFLLQ